MQLTVAPVAPQGAPEIAFSLLLIFIVIPLGTYAKAIFEIYLTSFPIYIVFRFGDDDTQPSIITTDSGSFISFIELPEKDQKDIFFIPSGTITFSIDFPFP